MPHTNSLDQSYCLLFTFLMLSKRRIFELGARCGLTGMQAIMLLQLDEPHPMNSLRKNFNCDASNVTGLVDGLERKKLASRYEAPDDRRIKMVKLEPKGKEVRTTLLGLLGSQDSPLSRLSPAELQSFIALLRKINNQESNKL